MALALGLEARGHDVVAFATASSIAQNRSRGASNSARCGPLAKP